MVCDKDKSQREEISERFTYSQLSKKAKAEET